MIHPFTLKIVNKIYIYIYIIKWMLILIGILYGIIIIIIMVDSSFYTWPTAISMNRLYIMQTKDLDPAQTPRP